MAGRDPWSGFRDITPGKDDNETEDPWAGFHEVGQAHAADKGDNRAPAPVMDEPVDRAIDGDTLRLESGRRVRLPVVDAPELRQQGWDRNGNPVPIGQQSLDAMTAAIKQGQARLGTPIGQSYGRTVAPVSVDGRDLGLNQTADGWTEVDRRYLPNDPQQRYSVLQAERLARQNFLGVHRTMHQPPAQFRADPDWQPTRETVAQFWDTPTPQGGMAPDLERQFHQMVNDPGVPIDQVVAFAKNNGGFIVDPANVTATRAALAKTGVRAGIAYAEPVKPLTDPGDGRMGTVARQVGQGVVMNQLEELGAIPDTLGLTPRRENIWNSDRRLADIYANNLSQNEAITGYDRFAHPNLSMASELGGALVLPMGRVRNATDLAKWGAAYGAVSGLGQEGTIPERLTSGVIGAGMGLGTTVVAGKALERLLKDAPRLAGRERGNAPEAPPGAPEGNFRSVPPRVPDRIDVGPASPRSPATRDPLDTHYPGPTQAGRERDWIDTRQAPPPPPGFRLDDASGRPRQVIDIGLPATMPPLLRDPISTRYPGPASGPNGPRERSWIDVGPPANDGRPIAMEGSAMPSISQPMSQRVPDFLFTGERPQRLTDPLSDARLASIANDIRPADVLPIHSNEVGSVEERAAIDAGRYAEARAPDERTALDRQTLRTWNGAEVPKVGPVDMIGWARLNGGLRDQGGELSHMGATNAARRMEHVGQEQRFGPLVNDQSGMSLDDAAQRAWEAGYFPELTERPSVNQFLDAFRDTLEGRNRRFLPEDMPQVERFDAMRDERVDLERLRSETGGPVYVDRSAPADEPPPFAPPQAYEEWPAGGPDFAGNIDLRKLSSPQDIKRALSTINNRIGFDAATRGRVAQAETQRLANEIGMSPETLLARRRGQAFNAEEALAARQILAKSGNELVNLARGVQAMETPGDDVLARFSEAMRRHAAIQEQVSGMTAEAGRTLQQFRMLADSRNVNGEVLARFVDGNGGRGRLQDAATAILDTIETDPGKFNPLVQKLAKPRWIDKAVELMYAVRLSGPQTHAANSISNTLTALGQIPEHAAASAIGLGRRALLGAPRTTDRVYPLEVSSRAFGLLQGVKDGIPQFVRTLRTGETSDLVTKVEAQVQEAIPGRLGKIVRMPTRALSAEDELFKAMARRMELYGLADREASAKGLRGEAKARHIAETVANPSDIMLEKAFDYARYVTFQRPLSGYPQSVSAFTSRHPTAKFVIPFVRTPTNLLKFASERSPFAPLVKEWRADFKAGGARRDLAVAKAMVGSGIGFWMADLAKQGIISGSAPSDKSKANLQRADGWQPYSIRVGDQWYSYSRMDPFGLVLGTAADLATKRDGMSPRQLEDASGLLVASVIKNMGDKTWLSGLSDLFEMLGDPQRNLGNYAKSQTASLVVPAAASQLAGAVDPVRRESDSVVEEVRRRLPWLSQSLPPSRDVWGRPVKIDRVGPDIASPVLRTTVENDPVNREMLRLGAPSTEFPKSRRVNGKTVDFTPGQYDQLQEKAGRYAYQAIGSLVASPAWKEMEPAAQRTEIERSIKQARAAARAEVLGGAPAKSGNDPWDGFKQVGGRRRSGLAGAPKLPGNDPWSSFKPVEQADIVGGLQRAIPGIQFTSGFRTPEYQAEMRRRGYKPAGNSSHLDGSALDMLPPPGKSLGWLRDQVRRKYPDAPLLIHDGHLHATFPNWFGAPVLGGARRAGLRNPNARD